MDVDVVVIGAGVAGLTAAATLTKKKHTVALLEARDTPGGRVRTWHVPGLRVPLELGAEFVHGRPPKLDARLDAAKTKRRDCDGPHWLWRNGEFERADDTFDEAMALFGEDVPPGVTVAQRIEDGTKPGSRLRALATSFAEGFYAADPRTASAAFIAEMTNASDELDGDRMFRVTQGYDALIDQLVDDLGRRATLFLSTAATKVSWSRGQVEVEARRHFGEPLRLSARACIVTLPQAVLAQDPPSLVFEPEPTAMLRDVRALKTLPIVKFHLVLSREVWAHTAPARKRGSFAFLHAPDEPVPTWWRPLPFEEPVLVGWVGGPRALELSGRPEGEQLRVALASLGRVLDVEVGALHEALRLYRVTDWGEDEHARGGYVMVPEGAEEAQRRWSLPLEDTLFFAGEAAQRDGHAGTVHGAMDTGREAARELLHSLSPARGRGSG